MVHTSNLTQPDKEIACGGNTKRSPRSKGRVFGLLLLVVSLVLSFRVFQFFPGMGPVHEAWFVLVALALVLIYLPWRWRIGGCSQSLETYVLLLILLIPIWSAFAAQRSFGQPLIFGLAAQRGIVLIAGVPLLIYQGLATRTFTYKNIENSLLFLAWSTLILYFAMASFLDAGSYFAAYGVAFVSDAGKDAIFKFNVVFIVFGFFYYALKGLRKNSLKNYILSGPFFLFLLAIIHGRSLLLSIVLTFFLLGISWSSNRARMVGFLIKATFAFCLALALLYLLNPELFLTLFTKFSDAFTVILTGELTDDASANARIQQTLLVLPYIESHWVCGNGLVSNQWNGGIQTAISAYFYPDDIGILGVVFLYGIFGALFYAYEFVLAICFLRKTSTKSLHPQTLMDASKGMVLFFAIRSLATAQFVFTPEPLLFFIGLLWLNSMRTANEQKLSGVNF